MSPITIRSKTESFRRAGLRFTRHGVTLDPETITEEQAKAIFAEPNLVVRVDTTDMTQEQVDAMASRAEQPAGGVEWVGGKKPSVEVSAEKPAGKAAGSAKPTGSNKAAGSNKAKK